MHTYRASTGKKKVPVNRIEVLKEPGSAKPMWVKYGYGTVYGFCSDETDLFRKEPGFCRKLTKNRTFERTPTNSWVREALGSVYTEFIIL